MLRSAWAGVLLICLCGSVSFSSDSTELRARRERFFYSLAWATLLQEQCTYLKLNTDKVTLVARDLGLSQDDMRAGGKYFPIFEKELQSVRNELRFYTKGVNEWGEDAFCRTALIMFGPDGEHRDWLRPMLPGWPP